jgi:hypothetical protein
VSEYDVPRAQSKKLLGRSDAAHELRRRSKYKKEVNSKIHNAASLLLLFTH